MTCSASWSRPPAPKKRKKSSLHRLERGFGDAGAVTGSELVDAGDFTQDVRTLGCIVERGRPNRLEASTNACRRVYRNAVDDPTCLAGRAQRGSFGLWRTHDRQAEDIGAELCPAVRGGAATDQADLGAAHTRPLQRAQRVLQTEG